MTGYELALLSVAAVFIAFALIVALVIPRARPDFPAKRLGVFVAVCIALFVVQMGAVLALAELGEEEHAEAVPPIATLPTETTETTTTETETEAETTETEMTETTTTEDASDPVGKEIFTSVAQPSCATCHTLADAGATGSVGPNLDATQPSLELVVDRVTNGLGGMPSFSGSLSEEEIQEVAAYVSAVAGS
jgi:mono/diheme cytochrome c family protein